MFPPGSWPQLHLLNGGCRRLYSNLQPFNQSSTNLLSCMTLDVENCHSTVHIKQVNMSMMEYVRSFEFTMKESVKKVTQWAAFYHTSSKSWFPKPKKTTPFSKVPLIKPLPSLICLMQIAVLCGIGLRRTEQQCDSGECAKRQP